MKKGFFSLLLVILTGLSHAQTDCQFEAYRADFFRAGEAEFQSPSHFQTEYLAVMAMDLRKFRASQKKKMEDALALLEQVVNSEQFKELVLNFKNTKGERAFASNKGLSNEQILSLMMEGREMLQQDTPGEMNFFLKLYYRPFSNVIGWTRPDINTIHVNKKYFKNFTLHQVAGNLMHEWLHKMGFGHASAKEHDSVPYGIGYIVREMGKEILKKEGR